MKVSARPRPQIAQEHSSTKSPSREYTRFVYRGALHWPLRMMFLPETSSGNVDPPPVLLSSTNPRRKAMSRMLLNVHFDTAAPLEPRKCPRSPTSDYRTSLLHNHQHKRHFHPSNRPPLPPPLLTLLRSMHSARLTMPFHPRLLRFSAFRSRHDLLRAKATVPRLPKLLYQG